MKSILLDSHTLLWALSRPEVIHAETRNALADPANTVFYSAASIWELELKAAKGKLHLPVGWQEAITKTGFIELPIGSNVATASARLPWHHSDPFDRLLIAQAMQSGYLLATRDRFAACYGMQIMTV